MARPLTPDELTALRAMPLGDKPNRVELALAMKQAKQTDIIAEYPHRLTAATVSRIVNGKMRIDVEVGHLFADFFGCQIEDLFPSREAVAS